MKEACQKINIELEKIKKNVRKSVTTPYDLSLSIALLLISISNIFFANNIIVVSASYFLSLASLSMMLGYYNLKLELVLAMIVTVDLFNKSIAGNIISKTALNLMLILGFIVGKTCRILKIRKELKTNNKRDIKND